MPALESLRVKQSRFVRMLAQLFQHAESLGYELTLGEAKRSDEQAEINALGPTGRSDLARFIQFKYPVLAGKILNNTGSGIRGSLHEIGLAIDLNLFHNGVFLSSDDDHRPLGEYWESIGGTWGGRFGDGNHYSISHDGKK